MAVNAYGDIRGPGPVVAGTSAASPGPTEATTIGVIVTNARLSKWQCLLLAQAGHDGLARALEPVHTAFDGDALVAAATGILDVDADRGTEQVERIRNLAAKAVEAAVRDGAASAQAAPSEDGR
jgi:L-aminopeptidase/D-esterase-like protein